MEKNKSSPPLDTAIPDYHDFIFIKEVDTTNGVLYLGVERGGAMSFTTFGTWGRGRWRWHEYILFYFWLIYAQ